MALPFTLLQLEAFACVCECGTITRAAKKLTKDRTTISELLSSLEDDLGYLLFDRQTRPLTLTPQGNLLYRQARLFLQEARAFSVLASDLSVPNTQIVKVSYDVFTPRDALVRLVSALEPASIILKMRCETREEAEQSLQEGRSDVGLYQALNQPIRDGLSWRTVGAIELAVYASPQLFSHQPVSMMSLASRTQLLPWQHIPAYLVERIQIADRLVQVNDLDLLMALMAAGKGWAMLPTHMAAEKREGIVRIETAMGTNGLLHPMVALWQPGQGEHPATKHVLDQLTRCFAP